MPFIVVEDADLDAAVDGAMLAKMLNVGEAVLRRTASMSMRTSSTSSRASSPSAWPR